MEKKRDAALVGSTDAVGDSRPRQSDINRNGPRGHSRGIGTKPKHSTRKHVSSSAAHHAGGTSCEQRTMHVLPGRMKDTIHLCTNTPQSTLKMFLFLCSNSPVPGHPGILVGGSPYLQPI